MLQTKLMVQVRKGMEIIFSVTSCFWTEENPAEKQSKLISNYCSFIFCDEERLKSRRYSESPDLGLGPKECRNSTQRQKYFHFL